MTKPTKHYWFKRRRYGWGWTPVTWQGWLSVGLFIFILLTSAMQLPPKPEQPSAEEWRQFLSLAVLALAALLVLSYAKGPKPQWCWGAKPGDNPDEDI